MEGTREEVSRARQLRQNKRSVQSSAARNLHGGKRSLPGGRPRARTDDGRGRSRTPRETPGSGTEGIRKNHCGGKTAHRSAIRRKKEKLGSRHRRAKIRGKEDPRGFTGTLRTDCQETSGIRAGTGTRWAVPRLWLARLAAHRSASGIGYE